MVGRSSMKRMIGGFARRGSVVAAALILVGLPAQAADPSPDASPPPVPFVADLPPVDISPVLDPGASAGVTLSPDEPASLTTTDAVGTTYTLTAPAGAVDVATDIAMTPIAGVTDLPFASGLLFGVDLSPSGLVFDLPLRLEVRLADGTVPGSLAAWDYLADGDELALVVPELLPDGLAFDIWHFSGVGGSVATPAEVSAQARAGTSSFDRAFQQYLVETARLPEGERAQAVDTALEGYSTSLLSRIAHAGTCVESLQAIREIAAADRAAQRVGSSVRPVDLARATGHWSATHCLEEIWKQCADDHDLGAIYRFIRLQRYIDAYGLVDYLGRAQHTRPWVDGCARWEFILDSTATLTGEGPSGGKLTQGNKAKGSTVFTAVPEPIRPASGPWELDIEISQSKLRLQGKPARGCRLALTADKVSGVRINRLHIVPAPSTSADGELRRIVPQQVRMGFEPGVDQSEATVTCRGMGSFSGWSMKPWNQRWRVHLDKDGEAGGSLGFLRFLFEAENGEVRMAADYARKVYNRTAPITIGGKLKEHTTVELWHRPQRPAGS